MPNPTDNQEYSNLFVDEPGSELESMLYARHVEVESFNDLTQQRGTPIPALFNQFYKFVQNPSTVSVETFKRMVDTDDTIGSGVDFLTTCMAARLGGYQHPSKEITDFVNKALEHIDGGFHNAVKELASASWAGFAVAEKQWENHADGFLIRRLVTLPPSTILFETERTGELTSDGILQYQRNWNPYLFGRGLGYFGGAASTGYGFTASDARPDLFARLGDLPFPLRTANTYNYLSIRIPKLKCVHYAFDAQGKFGNPYGRSLLRRCYNFYVMKHAMLQMFATALDRKGTPLTVIYANPHSTLMDSERSGGANSNPYGDRAAGIRADVAAARAFKNIHNDSVITLPGKKGEIFDVDILSQQSNASDFIAGLDFCNKSILRSLLIPTLIFGNGDGTGSYSLGQEHARTFDKILDSVNTGMVQVLLQQVVKEIIAYNFPESAWKKDGLGSFSKRELTTDEKQKEADLLDKAVNMGAIDMSDLQDLNKAREIIGFEPRKTPIVDPMAMQTDPAETETAEDDGDV